MRAAAIVGLAVLVGCGGATQGASVATDVQVRIRGDAAGGDPFDPKDPRLGRAVRRTGDIAGHPVAFHFHLELMPNPRGEFFERLFDRHIGLIPSGLERLRERDEAVFRFAVPLLDRVELRYDGTQSRAEVRFLPGDGTLRIVMGSDVPVPRGGVRYALLDAYQRHLVRTYAERSPKEVSENNYRAYFRYLDRHITTGEPWDSEASNALWFHPKAIAIERAALLHDLVGEHGADLRERIRDWLIDEVDFFIRQHVQHDTKARKAPRHSPFSRAQRAWAEWFRSNQDDLSDEQLRKALPRLVIPEEQGRKRGFPGLDYLAVCLRIVDRWIAAGTPIPEDGRAQRSMPQALYEHVVCPYRQDDDGDRRLTAAACRDNAFYDYAVSTTEARNRLVEAVAQRDNAAFAEAVAMHLRMEGEERDLLYLWHELEEHPALWRRVTVVITEELQHERTETLRNAVYDGCVRMWRNEPTVRPTALYMLAVFDTLHDRYQGMVEWKQFRRVFGSRIGAEVFAGFLDHGALAAESAWGVWPALGRGWAHGETFVEAVDEHEALDAIGFQLVRRMREQGDSRAVRTLRRYLKRRVQEHPSEARRWRSLIDEMGGR